MLLACMLEHVRIGQRVVDMTSRSVLPPRVSCSGLPVLVEQARWWRRPARPPPSTFRRGASLIEVGEDLLDHHRVRSAGDGPDRLTTTFTLLCLRLPSGAQLVRTRFLVEWPLMWGKRSVWAVPPMPADGWVRPVVPTRRGAVQRERGMPQFDLK